MEAADVLEFEALKALVSQWVRSPMGRAELDRLVPVSNRSEIAHALACVSEGMDYLRAASRPQAAARGAAIRPRFDSLADPQPALERLRIEGATLDGREIYELSELLERAAEIRSILIAAGEKFPRLAAMASDLGDFRAVIREFRGRILPDGSLADDASPLLERLRRDADRQQKRIHESLERFLRAHREDGTLQEEFVTIRNERLVVPVVAGRERRIEGVIHGTSASGHTMFVEPLETIELNNELVRLREEEMREAHRILREFTARLREYAAGIAESAAALGRLDLIFGKAEYGVEFAGVTPVLGERLHIRAARHPLLENLLRVQRKPIVPTSLNLDPQNRTLLISGPNTGGKTVALKTVGLAALATHAGLPVPADEAEFPVFDQILADIGDHQSIQESLSTFSAHVYGVKRMLDSATAQSLVLLDELGRATDPEEGGALGVAILDTFRTLGAYTLASTHLLALKIYGATAPGVINASMGFDDQTLQPTYILRTGAPGKSAGIEIASRLGLEPELIERARAALGARERDLARFLDELDRRLAGVAAEERSQAEKRAGLDDRERSLERESERKYAAKLAEFERASDKLIEEFEKRANETVGEILESKARQKVAQKVAKTRREFEEQVQQITRAEETRAPALQVAEGARVRLKGVRQPAVVRKILGGGLLEVEAGVVKMRVEREDIEEVLGAVSGPPPARALSFTQGPRWDTPYQEINVIGERAEEACAKVDKFMDSAALAGVVRVRIVHGHGMGVLKRAIADLLKNSPHVEKFYEAPPQEGGAGATIAELKA